MNSFLARLKVVTIHTIKWFEKYPIAIFLLALGLFVYGIWTMSDRQSMAGSWMLVLVGAGLFLWGLSVVTGMSLRMSF